MDDVHEKHQIVNGAIKLELDKQNKNKNIPFYG